MNAQPGASSLSIRHWWNRITLLLVATGLLNISYVYQHETQLGQSSLLKTVVDDFRLPRNSTQRGAKVPRESVYLKRDKDEDVSGVHKVAGLSCQQYGGPPDEIAAEMVYWSDIPSDAKFVSPFHAFGPKVKYLTFEPDMGGFNNVRMAMETVVAMAHAMGRTLVLPPEQRLLFPDLGEKAKFTFGDFFHFDSVAHEHVGIDVISFDEFLRREALTGKLRDKQTGQISYPPDNRPKWDGEGVNPILLWMQSVSAAPIWNFDECVVAFPAKPGAEGDEYLQGLNATLANILAEMPMGERILSFRGLPTPVDAKPESRLRELIAHRTKLCFYDSSLQEEKVLHLMGASHSQSRLLVHFYAFLFFEDWRHDLWTKRFIRDHLRYVDEIQCAAARVVHALRKKSRENGHGGLFDAMHIRRGDFQYTDTRLDASALYNISREVLVPNTTLYIATDERNKTFFDVFRARHKVYFFEDFEYLVAGIQTNYYGMIDQRITTLGETFIGTYYSTFSGYINRMRGYRSQQSKADGHELGKILSFYPVPSNHRHVMQQYMPIFPPIWAMEYAIGWRDIDRSLNPMHLSTTS